MADFRHSHYRYFCPECYGNPAGAIVLWNTTYLEAAMRHLERQGRPLPTDMLQHLSPLGWQHINLTGDYLWTDPVTRAGQLRPLRQVPGPPPPRNA